MKSARWILTAAFLAMATVTYGQRASNWRAYKAADGLPETTTASVTVAPRGPLWVRCPNVEWIGWLNGYDVKAIPAPDLQNNRIYESPGDQIWAFSGDELLEYRQPDRGWVHYSIPEVVAILHKNNPVAVQSPPLRPFKQNHVLMLLPDELLDCSTDNSEHPETSVFRAVAQTGLKKFLSLALSRDGGLWVAGERGLAKLPGPIRNLKPESPWEEFLAPDDLQIHHFRQPEEDDDGGVTVLAESIADGRQVVVYFDGKKWSAQKVPQQKIIRAWRGTDGVSWALTPTTVLISSAEGQPFTTDPENPARRYFDAATETNGIFFLASSDGLFRYAPRAWRTPSGLPSIDTPANAITEDSAGRLWVLTASALWMRLSNSWTQFALPPEAAGDPSETRKLYGLTNGAIVWSVNGSLQRFDPSSSRFEMVQDDKGNRLKPLGLLHDGTLCVQADNRNETNQSPQLEIFDGAHFNPPPFPLPGREFGSDFQLLFSTQGGDLWLTSTVGLTRYDGKKWQSFRTLTQPMTEVPRAMIELDDGKLWCGVQDAVLQFDGTSWNGIRSGFYHVNGLFKARDGSVWVASENGIHRFYRNTWIANGAEEGVPDVSVRQVLADHNGHIWGATARGLTLYHPDADADAPQTYVQNLPEPDNTIREGKIVTISFSASDKWKYTTEDRLMYSYQMDGQDWSPYQEQRNASFLDLAAGKHVFRVRSMDRNWNVDLKPALLNFTVDLPWYRESRLVLISAGGLAIVIFFASLALNRHQQLLRSYAEVEAKVALRTKQLDLANRELFHSQKMNALGTLAAGIAHDFNNILSIIKGSAQIIEDNLENTSKIRTRTDRIKMVVEQGAGIVRAMLGFSRVSDRHVTLCQVNDIVRETITLLGDRFSREIEVRFMPANETLPPVPASKDFIQQILLNFIFNSAEAMLDVHQVILTTAFSRELPGSLALKPVLAAEYVLIAVRDFGSGIAPENMPRIFEPFFTTKSLSVRRGTGLGLSMVYELARQMDSGLSVESKVGEGSVFTLIIPVRDLPVDLPEKTDRLG